MQATLIDRAGKTIGTTALTRDNIKIIAWCGRMFVRYTYSRDYFETDVMHAASVLLP